MCTAVSTKEFFGRNLDLETSFGEGVLVVPNNYILHFKNGDAINHHYAMIGIGIEVGGYPLYYDAINEKGLGMAGLNFPYYALYKVKDGKKSISSFEFIPFILSQAQSAEDAKSLIDKIAISNDAFSETMQPSPLHWLIGDREKSIVVESTAMGLNVYDNPIGVMTNSPPFPFQEFALNNYISLSKEVPENKFSSNLDLKVYSRGMGALGLPGDLSSQSRFIKASFTKMNYVYDENKDNALSDYMHILSSVEQQRGLVDVNGKYEITIYSSAGERDRGIYYYKSYENSQIRAVKLTEENMRQSTLSFYPMNKKLSPVFENQ